MATQSRRGACLALFFLLLSCILFKQAAAGVQHTVGDSAGWTIMDYSNWETTHTFMVGDTLYFDYSPDYHNVMEVTQADYMACNKSNPIKLWDDGATVVPLNKTGSFYFICGVADHCKAGQKISVMVADAVSPSRSPTPAIASDKYPLLTSPSPAPAPMSASPSPAPTMMPISPSPAPVPMSASPSPAPTMMPVSPSPHNSPSPSPSASPRFNPAATPSSSPSPSSGGMPSASPSAAPAMSPSSISMPPSPSPTPSSIGMPPSPSPAPSSIGKSPSPSPVPAPAESPLSPPPVFAVSSAGSLMLPASFMAATLLPLASLLLLH